MVITNEGPQRSKPSTKRTAKDEFDLQRMPLYVPPIKRDDTKLESELSQPFSISRRKKKTSVGKLMIREKTFSANKS